MKNTKKFFALMAAGALVLAACGGDDDSATSDTAAPAETEEATEEAAAGCIVGVSWNNYQEERWAKWDEPAIKAAIEAGGGTYISNDAKSSAETQASNLENLISQGAKALIVLAQDGTAIKPAVASSIGAGVPVVAYDRLIADPQALYLTFDNMGVGRLEAEEIFKRVPKGNYVIVKGSSTDANADFLREGFEEVIGAAVASGDIKIVSETYTDNWDPANAQATMEQVLSAEGNKVDA
ncbi:MAG: substrate-binding domain-containing protein, partial [Actinomycetota bacterium]